MTKEPAAQRWILHVESRPTSPEVEAEFNRWYDEVHVPEMVAFDGYVSARRLVPVGDDGPYITQYVIEGDPKVVLDAVRRASAEGRLKMSETLRMDPVPTMRLMRVALDYPPPAQA